MKHWLLNMRFRRKGSALSEREREGEGSDGIFFFFFEERVRGNAAKCYLKQLCNVGNRPNRAAECVKNQEAALFL